MEMSSIPYTIQEYESHAKLLYESHLTQTGKSLISVDSEKNLFEELNNAPFALLSHGTEEDPIFNYGNRTTLDLFEMSFPEFTKLPSRKSAEVITQEERNQLMSEVTAKGYISNYQGIRISAKGQRFLITKAVVWNLIDSNGNYCGQAAKLDEWRMLD